MSLGESRYLHDLCRRRNERSKMDISMMFSIAVAGLTGLVIGWVIAWRVIQRQVRIRRQSLTQGAPATRKKEPVVDVVPRAELERERAKAQRDAVASAAEQRALVAHLEGKLRIAQMDIERLTKYGSNTRRKEESDEVPTTGSGSGFADTQPFAG